MIFYEEKIIKIGLRRYLNNVEFIFFDVYRFSLKSGFCKVFKEYLIIRSFNCFRVLKYIYI